VKLLTCVGEGRIGRWFNFDFVEYMSPGRGHEGLSGERTRLESGDVVVEIINDYVNELLRKVIGSHICLGILNGRMNTRNGGGVIVVVAEVDSF
jgi:hypothetical protein